MKGQHESIREVFIKWERGQPSLYTHNRLLDRFSDMALYTFQLNGFENCVRNFAMAIFVFLHKSWVKRCQHIYFQQQLELV